MSEIQKLHDATFQTSSLKNDIDGAFSYKTGSLSLQNSIIRGNYGIIKGAGITIERDGIVEMTNVIFQHNYAQTSFLEGVAGGGALYVEAGASVSIMYHN